MADTIYENNYYAPITGLQMQQGTNYSSQNQTVSQGFNYEEVRNIIENIKKYEDSFDSEFKEKANELRDKIQSIENLIEKKENPSTIKYLLTELKNLAIGVSGSLIASGIAAQISYVIA